MMDGEVGSWTMCDIVDSIRGTSRWPRLWCFWNAGLHIFAAALLVIPAIPAWPVVMLHRAARWVLDALGDALGEVGMSAEAFAYMMREGDPDGGGSDAT